MTMQPHDSIRERFASPAEGWQTDQFHVFFLATREPDRVQYFS
jgi:hypothetical protein